MAPNNTLPAPANFFQTLRRGRTKKVNMNQKRICPPRKWWLAFVTPYMASACSDTMWRNLDRERTICNTHVDGVECQGKQPRNEIQPRQADKQTDQQAGRIVNGPSRELRPRLHKVGGIDCLPNLVWNSENRFCALAGQARARAPIRWRHFPTATQGGPSAPYTDILTRGYKSTSVCSQPF